MDSASKLHAFCENRKYDCHVIGVPKTIDNDLIDTDHTPGYGSAAKYIATTFAEIEADISCYAKGRVTVVEVMGRDAGWLTAASKLACLSLNGPDLIYLPEHPFDEEKFLKDVEKIYNEKKKVLVAVSEGVKALNGQYLIEKDGKVLCSDKKCNYEKQA
jgi:6-phosphofructokinase 1